MHVAYKSVTGGKEASCQCRRHKRRRFDTPGGGHGNPLQYSCLENSMDIGAWQAVVHVVAKSRTQLSTLARICGVPSYMSPALTSLSLGWPGAPRCITALAESRGLLAPPSLGFETLARPQLPSRPQGPVLPVQGSCPGWTTRPQWFLAQEPSPIPSAIWSFQLEAKGRGCPWCARPETEEDDPEAGHPWGGLGGPL